MNVGFTIYHGTPMTPRAALLEVGKGRAFCVSFFRPDDCEAVEAISPAIMFRQRRFLRMDFGNETRRILVRSRRLETLLSLARGASFPSGAMGGDTGRAGRAFAVERRASKRLAVRCRARRAALAYGRPAFPTCSAMRTLPARGARLDRQAKNRAGRLRRISPENGRSSGLNGQHLAPFAYDARRCRRFRLSVFKRGLDVTRTKRTPLFERL